MLVTRMMYGPTEIGKPPPASLSFETVINITDPYSVYVAGPQSDVDFDGLEPPPLRFRQADRSTRLERAGLGGRGDRKGSFPLPLLLPMTPILIL